MHGSLGLHVSIPKRHLGRFGCFCTVQQSDQHTDAQKACPHLALIAVLAMRANNEGVDTVRNVDGFLQ